MSYVFDGSGSANLNAAAPLADTPVSMACWFKVAADGFGHALMCLGNESDSEIFRLSASFDIGGDPVVFRAVTAGGTTSNVSTSAGATLDTWHHAGCVALSDWSRAVYLDGANKGSVGSGTRTIAGATRLAIGAMFQNGSYSVDTQGKIAHAAVWNIDLGDADWAALGAGANPLTIQPDHLVRYWALTEDLIDDVVGAVLTNGGGVTFDGADNPAVDAPPGGALAVDGLVSTAALADAPVTVIGALAADGLASDATLASPGMGSMVLLPDDEDADSYDTATTQIIGDTLYLEGYYDGLGLGGWVNTNCRAGGGIDGATYNFVIDASGKQTPGSPNGNNDTTGDPWAPPFYAKIGGVWGGPTKTSGYSYNSTTEEISGTFVWPTGATEIRLAYKPVVTVAELDAFREEIYASPHAIEPPSSVAASSLPEGVHARLSHGTGPNSVPAGTVDLWGARIGTGPFTGMVVFCEHSQEDVGDLSAMQFIRWMLGASSEAADFRNRFSVYVYVHNLSGRKCGRTRYNQDVGGDDNPNREWDSSASEQTNAVKAAIELDFPVASVDLSFMLAYHGQQDANVNTAAYDIYTTTEFAADQEFHARIATAVGSQVHQQDTSPPTTGTSKWFGHVTRSAPLSLTLEHADAATGYPDAATMHDAFAAATGETLNSLAVDGYFGALPLTVDGVVSTSALGAAPITAGRVLAADGVASTASLGAAGMSAARPLDVAALMSTTALGGAGISAERPLATDALASDAALGAAAITADRALAASGMVAETALGAAGITGAGGLVPDAMVSAAALGAAGISADRALAAAGLASAAALASPGLSRTTALAVASLMSTTALGSTVMAGPSSLTPDALVSQAALGVALLSAPDFPRPPLGRRMVGQPFNRSLAA